MNIFNIITLFGGLAMFLYGMRLMGSGLKEGSSGALKRLIEKVTGTPFKAFLLGLLLTAVIQSSTATIVITSGLVGAGIITLHQSLGIIIGANVGTTVTGQIIRLLDLNNAGATSILQFFQPSTLAPLALIMGIVLIMGMKFRGSDKIGQIAIGFGVLFSGLMNMTDAVSSLTENGIVARLFSNVGESPFIGYVIGATVAFILQSSSAAVGIMQAFATSGLMTFKGIYAVLVGIYLGDCVTTAIVCSIGAKADAKRVGIVNILFNLSKTVLILVFVNIAHDVGLLNGIWDSTVHSGGIANTNTIFNLVCAVLMLPLIGLYEKASRKLVRDKQETEVQIEDPVMLKKLDALNPVFFSTPLLALNGCYEVLMEMFYVSRSNITRAFDLINKYDEVKVKKISEDEEKIDMMADRVSNYLIQVSAHITSENHVEIMNHYYSAITEFERLGDHATNIAEAAVEMYEEGVSFSETAVGEMNVLRGLIETILEYTGDTFKKCDEVSAKHIEPLEEVVDDIVHLLKQNHLSRLREGTCSVMAGTEFLNMLSDIERISDICSNVGTATIARVRPELKHSVHDYVSKLHAGDDAAYNREYKEAHDRYFRMIKTS